MSDDRTSEAKRWELRQLEAERAKRNGKRDRIVTLLREHFVFHPKGRVKRNVLYELVSQNLGIPNGWQFKRMVSELLRDELGILPVLGGGHAKKCFKGLCTPEWLEAHLAHLAEVKEAARQQLRKISPLCKGTESARAIGKLGGRGNTREKRLAKECEKMSSTP